MPTDVMDSAKNSLRSGGIISPSEEKVEDLKRKHPIILAFVPEWKKYLDCYEGGLSITKSTLTTGGAQEALIHLDGGQGSFREYLKPHKREKSSDFDKRKERTHYTNYCRMVIDFWTSAIYREEQNRKTELKEIEKFWADADGKGTDIQTFMSEEVCPEGQIFGWTVVLIDMPNPPELANKDELTEADVEEADLRPRAKIICPLDILTWQTDSLNNLVFLRYKERLTDQYGRPVIRYKSWTSTEWFTHEADGTLSAHGKHEFGRVPAVIHLNVKSRKYDLIGISSIADIADINLNLFNLSSLIDEFAYDAAFPILYMEIRDEEQQMMRELGLTRGLGVPPDAATTPGFISPPSDPYELLLNWIKLQVEDIYRSAAFNSGTAKKDDAVDRRSALKTEIDKETSDSLLSKKATNLEKTERKMVELVYRSLNINKSKKQIKEALGETEIKYNKRFDYKALSQEFDELMKIDQFMSEAEELIVQKKKNITKKLISDRTIRKKIEDSLKGEVINKKLEDNIKMQKSLGGGNDNPNTNKESEKVRTRKQNSMNKIKNVNENQK